MDVEEYAKYTIFYSKNASKLLLKYLNQYSWKSFLDVGCGDGSLLNYLNDNKYLCHKAVYAVDLSRNRINLCKKINSNFKCFVNDACKMKDIDDNSINFLVSTKVIEHVSNDEEMIKEIARVVDKKNNIVYLTTVFKKWYGWCFYRCNKKWTLDSTHLREYTSDNQLLGILKKYGFDILESKKSLIWFMLQHFFLRRIGYHANIINNPFLKLLNIFKFPFFGYYNWEIVCIKK